MLDKLLQKLAGYLATKVTEQIINSLPIIIEQAFDQAVKSLPDAYESIADQVLDRLLTRLPFPFKR
jgi:hypothetical protein